MVRSVPEAAVVPPVLVEAAPVAAAPFEVSRPAASPPPVWRASPRPPCLFLARHLFGGLAHDGLVDFHNTLPNKARRHLSQVWPDLGRGARVSALRVEPHTPGRIRRDTHPVPARRPCARRGLYPPTLSRRPVRRVWFVSCQVSPALTSVENDHIRPYFRRAIRL